MPQPRNFEAGDLLGRYELLFPAGKGGMGQVWAAKLRGSQGFRKIVALKTLLASEAFSEEMQRMLRDEAMLASHIKNPHVAETLDFDLHEGIPYLVMEWVDGESLADLLHEFNGPMSLRHVVAIANQLCKGLDAAHKATDAAGAPLGLVHRDVSPPNILISFSGTVKLADFGIAQVSGAQEGDADKGLKAKFSYMAPEQIQGGALDARTDVFALAVLLYRLVTAKYPFAGAAVGAGLGVVVAKTSEDICSARTCASLLAVAGGAIGHLVDGLIGDRVPVRPGQWIDDSKGNGALIGSAVSSSVVLIDVARTCGTGPHQVQCTTGGTVAKLWRAALLGAAVGALVDAAIPKRAPAEAGSNGTMSRHLSVAFNVRF
jgi:tRNA A-37 threonylcarbamoyl transferase component Bud32